MQTGTYNAKNVHGRAAVYPPDSLTLGGYTKKMIVHERFGVLIPPTYPLKMAGIPTKTTKFEAYYYHYYYYY